MVKKKELALSETWADNDMTYRSARVAFYFSHLSPQTFQVENRRDPRWTNEMKFEIDATRCGKYLYGGICERQGSFLTLPRDCPTGENFFPRDCVEK